MRPVPGGAGSPNQTHCKIDFLSAASQRTILITDQTKEPLGISVPGEIGKAASIPSKRIRTTHAGDPVGGVGVSACGRFGESYARMTPCHCFKPVEASRFAPASKIKARRFATLCPFRRYADTALSWLDPLRYLPLRHRRSAR